MKKILYPIFAMLLATFIIGCGSDDDNKTNPENNNNNTSENKISLEGDWIGNPMRGSGSAWDSCDMTCVFRNNTISILRVSKEGAELERVSGTYTLTDNIITATWTIGRYDTEQLRMSDFKGTEMKLTLRNIIYKLRLINNHGGGNGGGGNNYGSDDDYNDNHDTPNYNTPTWVKCTSCNGSGNCKWCYGTGNCKECHGRTTVTCTACNGLGYTYYSTMDGKKKMDCSICVNGQKRCTYCSGTGNCIFCRHTGECGACQGKGGHYE